MKPMRQSGRVSLLGLLSAICAIVIVALLFFSKETPTVAGTRFMAALESHDVSTLTKMTKMDGASEDAIRKQWDFSVNQAERYYRFQWKVDGATQSSPTTASVKVRMYRDADKASAFEEQEQLPMVKVGDEWKVDVRALSREFYNCLPQ